MGGWRFSGPAGVQSTSCGGKWAPVRIQTSDKLSEPQFLFWEMGIKITSASQIVVKMLFQFTH